MDLTMNYLGLKLKNPLLLGASPLGASMDSLKELEQAGIGGVVLPSLFEEEILAAARGLLAGEAAAGMSSEAQSYLPDHEGYHVGPGQYLDHLKQAKDELSIPVIASLNGSSIGGWVDYAGKMAEAGADAIELNAYYLSTDHGTTSQDIENQLLEVVRQVSGSLSIPLAVKLSPFFSALPNFAESLKRSGAAGIVLFNRFYQPDIDIDALEVVPNLRLSTSEELRLRLRWLAILSGRVELDLACSGGVHSVADLIKAVMSGARAVQLVSCLLMHGPGHVTALLDSLQQFLKEKEYDSLEQMRASMDLSRTPNPAAYSRSNYMRILDSWE